MSVLKNKRDISKVAFVSNALDIYAETINFLSRLSARYSRIMASDIARVAYEVFENAEKANAYYPSTPDRIAMRKHHLDASRASLMTLDASLALCYRTLNLNPSGAFTDVKGKSISSGEAQKRLDKMSQSLGDKINDELALLTGTLKSLP